MDFSWEGAVPTGDSSASVLRTPDDAMRILRRQCLELCNGNMPAEQHARAALVLTAISVLTVKTMTFVKLQHPGASPEQQAEAAEFAMRMLVAAALFVTLDLFGANMDEVLQSMQREMSDSVGYKFSRN
jgi:hypothetical protein